MTDYTNGLYIGLMSGTSMDGIDAVLVDFKHHSHKIVAAYQQDWPTDLQQQLKTISQTGNHEIDQLGELDIQVANLFAQATLALLKQQNLTAKDIQAIGSHGQTIRHRPHAKHPFSLQIGDANRIAHLTGITTVADFRRRDIAAGGQGAPLVPAYHANLFGDSTENRVILNLGGIANITVLPANKSAKIYGFDTGPANTLMDQWIQQHKQQGFDHNGNWAASGNVISKLLKQLLSDTYFNQAPPKSTGLEKFNLAWLKQHPIEQYAPADIQATLLALSVQSISQSIQQHAPDCKHLIVCGGGAYNTQLIQQLTTSMKHRKLSLSSHVGVNPEHIEGAAFAWLARQNLLGLPGNIPAVTGADREVVLGGVFWGSV